MHHALLWNTRDMERYLILGYLGHTSLPFCLFEQYGKKEIKNTSTTSTLDMIIPFLKKKYYFKVCTNKEIERIFD